MLELSTYVQSGRFNIQIKPPLVTNGPSVHALLVFTLRFVKTIIKSDFKQFLILILFFCFKKIIIVLFQITSSLIWKKMNKKYSESKCGVRGFAGLNLMPCSSMKHKSFYRFHLNQLAVLDRPGHRRDDSY